MEVLHHRRTLHSNTQPQGILRGGILVDGAFVPLTLDEILDFSVRVKIAIAVTEKNIARAYMSLWHS